MFPLDLNLLTEKYKKHNPFLNNCANECTHTQSNTKKTRKQKNVILKYQHNVEIEKALLSTYKNTSLPFKSTQDISTHNKIKKRY